MSREWLRDAGLVVVLLVVTASFVTGAHYNIATESLNFHPILGAGLLAVLLAAWLFSD